jgi:hypothetical protein
MKGKYSRKGIVVIEVMAVMAVMAVIEVIEVIGEEEARKIEIEIIIKIIQFGRKIDKILLISELIYFLFIFNLIFGINR